MLCFVVITDGFRNINAHVEAKQARKEKKKKHGTSEAHFIVKN